MHFRFQTFLALLFLGLAAGSVSAQTKGGTVGASAILLGTVAAPAVNDRTLAEAYVSQPMLTGSFTGAGGRLSAHANLNFEGLTLARGELNAGMHGEGYVDRRHPHTYLSELVATAQTMGGPARMSVTVGKGFAPFGTDDPMSRPLVKYPVNHHLAQILERAIVSVAVARGPLVLEAAAFNGDEPETPSDFPNADRLLDSWAARLTMIPAARLEIQGSHARVTSPELALGGGLDQQKTSASARYEAAGRHYALVEYALTDEMDGGRLAFSFASALAEGAVTRRRFTVAARIERTERPEEERLANPFRTQRPAHDVSIHGRTRWDVISVAGSARFKDRSNRVAAPFLEISLQRPTALVSPAAFEPRAFYGSDRLWSFSAGLRLSVGTVHQRMGRYGAAVAGSGHDDHKGHTGMEMGR